MKAISQELEVIDAPTPEPGAGEKLMKVAAAGVNRGDILQNQGHYPPPKGVTSILGLEAAGYVDDKPAIALLAGGGYAEYVAVPEGQLMPKPDNLSMVELAGVVEVACTVWSNLGMLAGIREGSKVLIHGGSGGIGSFAIQLCKALGCEVATTAGNERKLEYCRSLGADITINYREQNFADELKGWADVILDVVGGPYLEPNVKALAVDGQIVVIALQGGPKGEISLGRMMPRRQSLHATTLRARPRPMKADIVRSTIEHVWPLLEAGKIAPNITATFPLARAAEAHELMDSGDNVGKIVLEVSSPRG